MKTTSLNELTFGLMQILRSKLTDEDTINKRLVIYWIQSARASFLHRRYSKGLSSPSESIIQEIPNLVLEHVESNTLGIPLEKYLQRTEKEIPLPITDGKGIGLFTYIGPPDYSSSGFSRIMSRDEAISSGYGTFNKDTIYPFYLNNRIYLISRSGYHLVPDYITVRGVFQDAVATAQLVDPTWTYDDQYPVDKDTIDLLYDIIQKEKLSSFIIQPYDYREGDEEAIKANAVGQTPKTTQQK